jgi:hypothetical protein
VQTGTQGVSTWGQVSGGISQGPAESSPPLGNGECLEVMSRGVGLLAWLQAELLGRALVRPVGGLRQPGSWHRPHMTMNSGQRTEGLRGRKGSILSSILGVRGRQDFFFLLESAVQTAGTGIEGSIYSRTEGTSGLPTFCDLGLPLCKVQGSRA